MINYLHWLGGFNDTSTLRSVCPSRPPVCNCMAMIFTIISLSFNQQGFNKMDLVNDSEMALTSDFVVKSTYKLKHMMGLLIQAIPDP